MPKIRDLDQIQVVLNTIFQNFFEKYSLNQFLDHIEQFTIRTNYIYPFDNPKDWGGNQHKNYRAHVKSFIFSDKLCLSLFSDKLCLSFDQLLITLITDQLKLEELQLLQNAVWDDVELKIPIFNTLLKQIHNRTDCIENITISINFDSNKEKLEFSFESTSKILFKLFLKFGPPINPNWMKSGHIIKLIDDSSSNHTSK